VAAPSDGVVDLPSARDVAEAALRRIAERRLPTQAVLTPTPEVALADAARVDEARRRGEPLPLDGFTVVLKDNIDVAGVRTTCGAKFFADHVAERDASVVTRLRSAGALVLGKAQTTEFMFSLTAHPMYPSCLNPWDSSRIAGASSSGSAAAVADDQARGALGTDTGGSVRIPASFCGVTGLRPTFGVISTQGVFPLARSLDVVGPMARSARDVGALFDAIVGHDPQDSRSVASRAAEEAPPARLPTLRVGLPETFFYDECDPQIAEAVERAAGVLEAMGHQLVRIDLPGAYAAHAGFTELIRAEALAQHEDRLASSPDDFGPSVRERLELGRSLSATDVVRLVEQQHRCRQDLGVLFAEHVDVVLTPTTQCVAPRVVDATLGRLPDVTRLTYPWSFGHLPAISVPCGLTSEGLPIGLQIAGPRHSDRLLIALAEGYQTVTDFHTRRPPASTTTAQESTRWN
jgi:aspartyl-tRNA(Asn)/glutamyl-tRNA(Gln) amidotransferase subunit A